MKNLKKNGNISRRKFIQGAAGLSAASIFLSGCSEIDREAFFQKHFKELSKEELDQVIKRLEKEYTQEYGKKFQVNVTPPLPGVTFAYGLDLSRCIGCRRCVYACVKENNQSRNPPIHYITVLELDADKGMEILESDPYYNYPTVPREEKVYIPVACQQCRNPYCVRVCPVKTTWVEPDGIIVIDYNWCIGCRYCMAACPYGARKFNWSKPHIPSDELVTETHYLGNRPRSEGVVEKCTFCIQRVRKGRYPACVEICPVGARKFGNLLDEEGEIRQIIKNKRVFILKPELNTQPKFYYFYGI